MTLAEKLGEIVLTSLGPYENVNSGVARLCIPPLTLQDGPQGLAYGDVNVTQLPAPLDLAATFDVGLARSYGEVEGDEASGQGFDVMQGPTLNILRVPENGRAYEGFGEDPLLVSDMGVADVEGIQSRGVMAQAKEFVAYSQETDRGALDDEVATRPLEELYLRPFEAAVNRRTWPPSCAPTRELNGIYQCQDGSLLGEPRRLGVQRLRAVRPRCGPRPGRRRGGRDRPHQAGQRGRPDDRRPAGPTAGGSRRHRRRTGAGAHVRLRRRRSGPGRGTRGSRRHARPRRSVAPDGRAGRRPVQGHRAGVLPLSVGQRPHGGRHRCRRRR